MNAQPIRQAATVVLIRDAEPQFEIFMLERHAGAVFAGGMHVFPGGAVEELDSDAVYEPLISPLSEDQAGQSAAVGPDWQAYWVAGIRETFEESGFLLAYDENGRMLAYTRENDARFEQHRDRLNNGEASLADICQAESLSLALDRIHFYNRLITPPGRPRRFDTHFFITHVPESQRGFHDGTETVGSLWISPSEALARCEREEFGLMGATWRQLTELNEHQDTASLMEFVETKSVFPTYAASRVPD